MKLNFLLKIFIRCAILVSRELYKFLDIKSVSLVDILGIMATMNKTYDALYKFSGKSITFQKLDEFSKV